MSCYLTPLFNYVLIFKKKLNKNNNLLAQLMCFLFIYICTMLWSLSWSKFQLLQQCWRWLDVACLTKIDQTRPSSESSLGPRENSVFSVLLF